mgnify:FL=1|tara:strand:- start:628 stop:945 length:318 start_codon:yes stop_codon:yes gene_type:complete
MTYYYLLAVGGDCGPTGMSNKADCIPIDPSAPYFAIVREYLRNQLEIELGSATAETYLDVTTGKFKDDVNEHHRLGNKLIELGVFHHKWHKRTRWRLEEGETTHD